MNVLHISNTPLVGSPGKIVDCLNSIGITANLICIEDYPNNGPLYKKFTENSFVLNDGSINAKEKAIELMKSADIIHIHNGITPEISSLLSVYACNASYVYQVHSPIYEGPLYLDRSETFGLNFDKKLVIAQYQPRHYQDFIPVPNIVNSHISVNLRKDNEKLKILFSPTHSRDGRWNAKTSEKANKALEMLSNLKDVELLTPSSPIHPSLLLNIRRMAHLSIDEVVTGAFHQVSLESLMAGNITINNADFFSKMSFADYTGSTINENPFTTCFDDELFDTIYSYVKDVEKTVTNQIMVNAFANKYLDPKKLIEAYVYVYKNI